MAVVGIFTSGMYQFDDVFAYMNIEDVRRIFVVIGGADGVGIKVDKMMRAPAYADSLAERILLLVQNPTERLRMAKAAFEKIEEHYRPADMAESLNAAYTALLTDEPLPKLFESRGKRAAAK